MSRDGRPRIITLALLAASNVLFVGPARAEAQPDAQTPLEKRVAAVRDAASQQTQVSDEKTRLRAALSAAAKQRGVNLSPESAEAPRRLAQWFNWFNWNNWNNWHNWGNWNNWNNWANWVNM